MIALSSLPVHPGRSRSLPYIIQRTSKLTLTCFMATLLLACKIVVTVPEGGKVVAKDGFVCLAGQTCIIEVSDDNFDSTFTAMPAAGYTFTRWVRKKRSFCGNKTSPCVLRTTNFGGNPKLMDVLASDLEFYLEPIFVEYDVAYWQQVLEEIDTGTFSTRAFLYAINPIVGQCDPGALKQAPKTRALVATNQVRALHYLPVVDYDGFYDTQVQETSLVQRANNYLNHFPDPADACYTASAEEGASTSNLGSGSKPSDPAADVFGWTNDNNNLSALMEAGHRRWMLFPELGYVSYGQVEGFTALKVFSFGMPPMHPIAEDLEYVAMPYKFYPYVLVSRGENPSPWSISIVPPSGMSSSFNYFGSSQVKVIEKISGDSLPIQNLHMDNKGFGLANFLSWMVDGWDYDTEYRVKISNIRMPGGDMHDIEYPVVVDRYHLFNVNHPRESTDSKAGKTLQGKFNTAGDKDTYTLSLAGSVNVTGASEFSNMGFFILVYDPDKRLLKSSDQPFSMNFPLGKDTIVISPCDENGLCYQGTQNYTVTFN